MSESTVKQAIIVRRDLKMPLGKAGAQIAHAAMSFITTRLQLDYTMVGGDCAFRGVFSWEEISWMRSGFAKICLRAEGEEELLALKARAEAAGLTVHLITDFGRTVFHEPTITCIAIGPHEAKLIDPITEGLKLL